MHTCILLIEIPLLGMTSHGGSPDAPLPQSPNSRILGSCSFLIPEPTGYPQSQKKTRVFEPKRKKHPSHDNTKVAPAE